MGMKTKRALAEMTECEVSRWDCVGYMTLGMIEAEKKKKKKVEFA